MKKEKMGKCYKCNKEFKLKHQTKHNKHKITIGVCDECAKKDRQASEEKKKKKENRVLSRLKRKIINHSE